jgi:hypothetical protein
LFGVTASGFVATQTGENTMAVPHTNRGWRQTEFQRALTMLKARVRTGRTVEDVAKTLRRTESSLRQKLHIMRFTSYGEPMSA